MGPNGSLTSLAYTRIRADILAFRMKPGEKLVTASLCDTYNVSLGAIREALSRLTSDRLVIAIPHKGFQVAPITRDELEDLTKVRSQIETLCIASAIGNGDLKWEASIVSSLHELSGLPLRSKANPEIMNEEWSEVHRRFHQALVAACDSPWLLRLRSMLYEQSERYRRLSVPLDEAKRDVASEHRQIADAALARDVKKAAALLTAHLQETTRILRKAEWWQA